FWRDTNGNGLQEAGEPGINGVTVNLRDLLTNNIIATTVTAPSPINYPYLPYSPAGGTDGWYQFTGLCLGTYQVEFSTSQAALNGLTPTTTLAGLGLNPTTDSNLNPDPVILTGLVNPTIDETNDFGFVGVAPVTVQCAAATGV